MAKRYSLAELAELTNTKLIGNGAATIVNVDSLESATESDVAFLANPRYIEAMKHTKAGLICIDANTPLVEEKNFLISDNPSATFQKIVKILLSSNSPVSGFVGIHPTAVIHEGAKIGRDVTLGPNVVIDQHVVIGDRCKIYPSCYIGASVTIGEDCTIYPGVIIREGCSIGNRVTLQPGCVIGSCGFGYITDPQTGRHTKLEQLGTVTLEDDVEIGANTTIDRARFKSTLIRKGTKIDNLVQIAHNVELGENNVIVSQAGISGSTKFGKNVFLGGQAGVVGHIEITDNVKIAAKGGVSKSIVASGNYRGSPVDLLSVYNKREVLLRKIEVFVKEIKELKTRIEALEKKEL